ncbi:MAG: helix-turn-helix domain-containing protein, partial [Pseudomonadota bacterium]
AILAAARDVFIQHGFDGARVAEIGRRAGIAEGTVYLYYRTKSDLMEVVLGAFWADLTDGARDVINSFSDPGVQLEQFAVFHLQKLIEHYTFLDLAAKLRRWRDREPARRVDIRRYALLFDEIFQRCIDQGIARRDAPIWVTRDLFFGALEYSSRTILQGEARSQSDVTANVVGLLIDRDGRI